MGLILKYQATDTDKELLFKLFHHLKAVLYTVILLLNMHLSLKFAVILYTFRLIDIILQNVNAL